MMVLCKHCQNKCSPQAAACPKCGHPLAVHSMRTVQTIEQTSKTWKGVTLVGGIMVAMGFVEWLLLGGSIGLLAIGVAVMSVGQIGAWWCHG